MKKYLLLAIGLSFSLSLYSQTWLTNGTQWVSNYPFPFGGYDLDRYYVDGDTIVNNKTCKIIRRSSRYTNMEDTTFFYSVYGVAYEENDRVYRYRDNGEFSLIYDFNLKVGESISYPDAICGNEELTVKEIGTEDFDGTILRYQTFDYFFHGQFRTIKYYEKIGIKNYPNQAGYRGFFPTETMSCAIADPPKIFACFSNQNTSIPVNCDLEAGGPTPTSEAFLQRSFPIYPNPTTGRLHFNKTANVNPQKLEIFNLNGQKVIEYSNIPSNGIDLSHLENGIYLLKCYHKNQLIARQKIIKSDF